MNDNSDTDSTDFATPIPAFRRFRKNKWPGQLLTFDPGETTGWSLWEDGHLEQCGQLDTDDVPQAALLLADFFDVYNFVHEHKYQCYVVIEEYRIYSWKTESHAWKDIHTIRLIGAIEAILAMRGLEDRYQMCGAGLAKTFATDEMLKSWGFWKPNRRHARDAIRHGCYYYATEPPK